jgi:lysophospholipase L1-like esterase
MSRRGLLKGGLSAVALSALGSVAAAATAKPPAPQLPKDAVILFQGDSITDAGRKKEVLDANNSKALGTGYAAMLAGLLLNDHPDRGLRIYNRGISGNKVPDLAARWKEDAIDLKPTILSVLVGINDLWHTIAFGSKYKGTIKDYEEGYRTLIERSIKEIPGVRVVICEPFTLRKWPEFDPYRAVAKKLAEELKLTLVPFQPVFDQAAKAAPTDFWLWDGIHPTAAGNALMAQAWRQAVRI